MVAQTPDTVSKNIRDKLSVTAPGLSMEIGTVERKIVDACAEAISEATVSQYYNGSLLDIETKGGAELEQILGIFGFGRLQGRRATGVVRVSTSTPAAQDISIQKNTPFSVPRKGPNNTDLTFVTTQPGTILKGGYQIDIPVECTIVGTIGNVSPGSISTLTSVLGAVGVQNVTAMTGGVDPETDDELRARFRATFLRNIAGTEDFYRAMCLQNKNVSQVAIYGPTKKFHTQVVVNENTTNILVPSDVKYVWPDSEFIYKDFGLSTEKFFTKNTDYQFTYSTRPTFAPINRADLKNGEIVDVEFEYTSAASRNDPEKGLTNKVDIYVNGVDPVLVKEKTYLASTTFSSNQNHDLYYQKFLREGTNTPPSPTNRFTQLGSAPVVSFPDKIQIKNVVYEKGTHYFVVRAKNDPLAGSERERFGIEWLPTGPASFVDLEFQFTYNRVPELLNAQLKQSKQITTDVLVKQADYRYLDVHLSLEYNRGYAIQQVNNAVVNAIRSYISGVGFGGWIEISDIIMVAHQVPGVDNVWLTKQSENSAKYGIADWRNTSRSQSFGLWEEDFKIGDSQIPVLLNVIFSRKANR